MGKHKKDRGRLRQARVSALSDGVGLTTQKQQEQQKHKHKQQDQEQQQQILQTLTNGTPAQKTMACTAIAHLANNYQSTATGGRSSNNSKSPFVNPTLLTRLLPLLFVPDYDLRLSCAGALRNISATNSAACHALVSKEVVPAAVSLLSHSSVLSLDTDKRSRLLTQVVGLLSSLTEDSDKATQQLTANSATLITALGHILTQETHTDTALTGEITAFLLQITEENEQLVQVIKSQPSLMHRLMQLLAADTQQEQQQLGINKFIRVTAAGIIMNLHAASFPPAASASESSAQNTLLQVLHLLFTVLQSDLSQLVSAFFSSVQKLNLDMRQEMEDADRRHRDAQTYISKNQRAKKTSSRTSQTTEVMDVEQQETKESPTSSSALDDSMMDEDEKHSALAAPFSSADPATITGNTPTAIHHIEQKYERQITTVTQQWIDDIKAMKVSLELLTNLYSATDEEGEDTPAEHKHEQQQQQPDKDANTPATASFLSCCLLQSSVVQNIVAILNYELHIEDHALHGHTPAPAAELRYLTNVLGEEEGLESYLMFSSLRQRAVQCMMNILIHAPSLSTIQLQQTLMALCCRYLSYPASTNGDLIETVTALLVLINKLQTSSIDNGSSTGTHLPIAETQLHTLRQLFQQHDIGVNTRRNLISLFASLSLQMNQVTTTHMFATWILPWLHQFDVKSWPETDVLDVYDECVNALIDMYSADQTETVEMVKTQVIPGLQHAVQVMHRLLNSSSSKVGRGAEKQRYMESMGNAREFIKYKQLSQR